MSGQTDAQRLEEIREEMNNISPRILSYSQRCDLINTILLLCDRLDAANQTIAELQEMNSRYRTFVIHVGMQRRTTNRTFDALYDCIGKAEDLLELRTGGDKS